MATTLPTGAVKPTSANQTTSSKATSLIESLVATPTLPTGSTISPQLQNVATNELIGTSGVSGTVAAATPTAPTTPTVTGAATTAAQTTTAPTMPTYGQYTGISAGTIPTATAATGTVTAPAVAQTGAITDPATVKGQLSTLQSEVTAALAAGDPMPVWARGAAKATEAAMANRGMSASSMAAEALAEGIMNAAVPIATADAATYKQMIFQNLANNQQAAITNAQSYLQMDMKNLSNTQQTSLSNINHRQNTILSDQGALNAAAQFNATSNNQVNEFFTGLSSNIAVQNAQRTDAMGQYNTSETNKLSAINAGNQVAVNKANADREAGLNQFNASVQNQRDQFNAKNALVIAQANTQWRQNIATIDTAAQNQANMETAKLINGLTATSIDQIWQRERDLMSFAFTGSESAADRAVKIAVAKLTGQQQADLADQMGKGSFFSTILTGILGGFK